MSSSRIGFGIASPDWENVGNRPVVVALINILGLLPKFASLPLFALLLVGCGQETPVEDSTNLVFVSVAVEKVEVESESMRSFTTYGKIQPPRQVLFRAPAKLPIESIRSAGDQVKKGDLLIQFNIGMLKQQSAFLENSISRSASADERNRLAGQLKEVNRQIKESTVKAPFDLIVQQPFGKVGNSIEPGQPVLQAVENGTPRIAVQVSNWVKEQTSNESVFWIYLDGEQALCTVEYDPNWVESYSSQQMFLTQRLPEVTSEQRKTFQSVHVRFDFPQTIDGFWVPTTALKAERPGEWSLFGIDNVANESSSIQVAIRKPVTVIGFEGARAFVNGDFQAGDFVISRGTQKIVSGQAVKVSSISGLKISSEEESDAG